MDRTIELEVGNWHTNSLFETAAEFELVETPVEHKAEFAVVVVAAAVVVVAVAQT